MTNQPVDKLPDDQPNNEPLENPLAQQTDPQHDNHNDHDTPDAANIVAQLNTPLAQELGTLHNAPPSTAETTIASLPFGYRAALEAYGLITHKHREDGSTKEITITPLGHEAIKLSSQKAI
jgi:hypothetical protein